MFYCTTLNYCKLLRVALVINLIGQQTKELLTIKHNFSVVNSLPCTHVQFKYSNPLLRCFFSHWIWNWFWKQVQWFMMNLNKTNIFRKHNCLLLRYEASLKCEFLHIGLLFHWHKKNPHACRHAFHICFRHPKPYFRLFLW